MNRTLVYLVFTIVATLGLAGEINDLPIKPHAKSSLKIASPHSAVSAEWLKNRRKLGKNDESIVTEIDTPNFDADRAFAGSAPNASVDLYSGALTVTETDVYLPGMYGVDLAITRVYNSKVYKPRDVFPTLADIHTWVGLGWELNWGVIRENPDPTSESFFFELSGSADQQFFYATDGTGFDPNGNPTHDYRFESPISGVVIQPYLSKSFWRGWQEIIDNELSWLVQDPSGKIYQLKFIENPIADWVTTRIWHPKDPLSDIVIDYGLDAVTLTQTVKGQSRQVVLTISDYVVSAITMGTRTMFYNVEQCIPSDPIRKCLTSVSNFEGETVSYAYGTTAGALEGELTQITTPLGGAYSYIYRDQSFFNFEAYQGFLTSRVVGSWARGDGAMWTYTYDHPMPSFSGPESYWVSDKEWLKVSVDGPESHKKEVWFYTHYTKMVDSNFVIGDENWEGQTVATVGFRDEIIDGNNTVSAQVSLATTATELSAPVLYFTHVQTPRYKYHWIPLSNNSLSGYMAGPDYVLNDDTFVLATSQNTYSTNRFTDSLGTFFDIVTNPYGGVTQSQSSSWDPNAPDTYWVATSTPTYLPLTEPQKSNNVTQLIGVNTVLSNDGKSLQHTHQYNDFGDRTRIDSAAGGDATWEANDYDYLAHAFTVTRPNREAVSVQFSWGRPANLTLGGTPYRTATIDEWSRTSSITDGLSNVTNYAYDDEDRLTGIFPPAGPATQYAYDVLENGALTTQSSGVNPFVQLEYDAYGRKTKYTNSALSEFTQYQYDTLDRVIHISHPRGGYQEITYDRAGRPIETRTVRDGFGTETTTTSYLQYQGNYSVDPLGKFNAQLVNAGQTPTANVDAMGVVTEYITDSLGNITTIVRDDIVRNFTVNAFGWVEDEYHPESGLREYQHNAAGDVVQIDAKGNGPVVLRSTSMQYDGRGRLTRTDVSSGQFVERVYDAENLTTLFDENSLVEFEYDASARLTARHVTWLDVAGPRLTVQYRYSGTSGQLQELEYPSGQIVHYNDNNGLVDEIKVGAPGNWSSLVDSVQYIAGAAENATPIAGSIGYSNGMMETLQLDNLGRVSGLSVENPLHAGQYGYSFDLSWSFDKSGNLTSRETRLSDIGFPDVTEAYQYDGLSRLVRADYSNDQGLKFEDFHYDAQGNLFANGGTAPGNIQYTQTADQNNDKQFDKQDIAALDVLEGSNPAHDMNGDGDVDVRDAVIQVKNIHALEANQDGNPSNKLAGFVYDGLGNTLQTPDGMSYSYDGWGRLLHYDSTHHVQYDAESKRSATWSDLDPNQKRYVFYDTSGKPLTEYVWNGVALTLTQEHYYFDGSQIATDVHNPDTGCPERIWVHSDHLGSPRQFSDQSGTFIGYKDYYAFGDHWEKDSVCVPLTVDYTGHQSTASNDLIWMQARTYNSKYSRFLQPDPIKVTARRLVDPQELALYSYVRNNPMVFIDPTGLATWGFGFELKLGAGPVVGDFSIGLVFDDSGNMAGSFSYTHNAGVAIPILKGTPVFLAGLKIEGTDAKTIDPLEGDSDTYGIIAAAGDGIAAEVIAGEGYNGASGTLGPGLGVSVGKGKTTTFLTDKVNIYQSLPHAAKEAGMDFFEVTDEIGKKGSEILYEFVEWVDGLMGSNK